MKAFKRSDWMLKVTAYTMQQLGDPFYQGAAAEIAMYFMVSILPIMALLLQILGVIGITGQVIDVIQSAFPENDMVQTVMNTLLSSSHGNGVSIVMIVLTLWAASKLEFALIRRSNYTYGLTDEATGPIAYVKARFRAIFTIVFLILILVVSLVILVFGQYIAGLINMFINAHFQLLDLPTEWLFSALRWPISLAIYVFFIGMLYKTLPARRLKLRAVIPGALFSAVGMLVGTMIYFLYFSHISHFSVIYGSLATIIALLLWFWWLGYILIVGMVINYSAQRALEM